MNWPTRIRPMRVRKWYFKVAFMVVGYLFCKLISLPSALIGHGREVSGLVAPLCIGILVIVATRLFRGAGEDQESRRLWWRATSKPTAGWVIGSLFAVDALWGGLQIGLAASDGVVLQYWPLLLRTLVIAGIAGVLALYFLHSSARMRSLSAQLHQPAA